MSGFTAAYLSRLAIWILAAALVQGWLAGSSWRCWSAVTRGASAQLRYRLATAHFASLLVLPAATAIALHAAAVQLPAGSEAGNGGGSVGNLVLTIYAGAVRTGPALALIWGAGAGFMLAALLVQAWRLSDVELRPASPAVQRLITRLALRWPDAAAPLVCSSAARAPHVSGILRPVLFTPPNMEERLTGAEQEAVLLHELAHVRRRDFTWNLLQRLALCLVWFQPAAWRLYREVGREREACCDALAVEQGAQPAALVRALVRLAAEPAPSALARGIAGAGGGALTERIERLLTPQRVGPRSRWQAPAAAASLTLASLSAVGLAPLAHMDPALGDLSRASAFGPTIFIAGRDPRGPFQLRIRRGRVLAAAVGSRTLPETGIVQDGPRVTLLDPAVRKPLLSLVVSPGGRIHWEPRT